MLYLANVIDIASRRVVGWATANHLRTELVTDALADDCRQRRPTRPMIFYSDRGCHISQQFAILAREYKVRRPHWPVLGLRIRPSAPSITRCPEPSPGPAGPLSAPPAGDQVVRAVDASTWHQDPCPLHIRLGRRHTG
ncbi:hypothetical protein BM536_000085 [Streptomyces phaeoluteigriseus]|uniref:Integrase catalytic domain-containing protein n=1 Tax=Streptomyces phaeoluteigriseus TaxID=114686 RepID=A0A1V6MZP2_9ACTN|nr:hypothetical protein BM536_000085 [Streptomyces phaeoluteigriseus]